MISESSNLNHSHQRTNINDIKIAVASHKAYRMPTDKMYVPIHVGKALHPDIELGKQFITDDSGDNISSLNNYFSELTALYWICKNSDATYKGLVHYRRHFETSNPAIRVMQRDRFAKIVREPEVSALLTDSDIILPQRRNYFIETVYSHYAHTFPAEQLVVTREIITANTPEYLNAFDYVMQSTKAHMFNMMIMRNYRMNEYCDWLFPILFELQKRINPSQYDAFNARYPGRISEMLLDVWLITNGYPYKELPVISTEPVNWVKKGTAFLAAKFTGKKYSSSF